MNRQAVKSGSFIFLILSTVLLLLNIIDIRMIFFSSGETGLLDNMPAQVSIIILFAFPVAFLVSYVLYLIARRAKAPFGIIAKILFFFNWLGFISLLIFFFM